jgi:hypothetical protein
VGPGSNCGCWDKTPVAIDITFNGAEACCVEGSNVFDTYSMSYSGTLPVSGTPCAFTKAVNVGSITLIDDDYYEAVGECTGPFIRTTSSITTICVSAAIVSGSIGIHVFSYSGGCGVSDIVTWNASLVGCPTSGTIEVPSFSLFDTCNVGFPGAVSWALSF